MRIAILQCDHVRPDMRARFGDYGDFFIRLFHKQAPEIEPDIFHVQRGEYPDHLEAYRGFISTGSRRSVYDAEKWIQQFQVFVRKLFAEKRKFIGICFGHQMIAQALGGRCDRTDRGWGIGVKDIHIQATMDWMKPELKCCRLIVSHQDQITALPANAVVIGGNEHCPYGMIAVGDHFVGIQAHPEFTPDYAAQLMRMRADRIGEGIVAEAEKTLSRDTDQDVVAQWMVRFLKGEPLQDRL